MKSYIKRYPKCLLILLFCITACRYSSGFLPESLAPHTSSQAKNKEILAVATYTFNPDPEKDQDAQEQELFLSILPSISNQLDRHDLHAKLMQMSKNGVVIRWDHEITTLTMEAEYEEDMDLTAHIANAYNAILAKAVQDKTFNKGVILVTIFNENKNFTIEIQDNGTGIPRQVVQQAFDTAVYSTKKGTSTTGGSGVGLKQFALHMMKTFGGKVQIISFPSDEQSGFIYTRKYSHERKKPKISVTDIIKPETAINTGTTIKFMYSIIKPPEPEKQRPSGKSSAKKRKSA